MVLIRVDSYEITDEELSAEITNICRSKGIERPDKETIQQAIENLIDGVLILNEARNSNITVSDDERETELLDYMMSFKSEEQFKESLEEIKSSSEQLKAHLETKLMIKKYIDSIQTKEVKPDEKQLLRLYNENIESFYVDELVRVSHILIKSEMGIEKAIEVRDSIQSPKDFYAVVGCCSTCPSCLQAGDLGFILKGSMVDQFDEAAFSLELNEISRPVETKFGYHIIMLTDRKKELTLPFEDVKSTLIKRVCEIENELTVVRCLQDLKKKADIYIESDIYSYF